MNNLYRHGDLLLRRIEALPKGVRETQSRVLAEGEMTGHRHILVDRPDLAIYEDADGRKYFRVGTPTELTHQEHQTITIEKGVYVVEHEVEYDPFAEEMRRVQD